MLVSDCHNWKHKYDGNEVVRLLSKLRKSDRDTFRKEFCKLSNHIHYNQCTKTICFNNDFKRFVLPVRRLRYNVHDFLNKHQVSRLITGMGALINMYRGKKTVDKSIKITDLIEFHIFTQVAEKLGIGIIVETTGVQQLSFKKIIRLSPFERRRWFLLAWFRGSLPFSRDIVHYISKYL